MKNSGLLVVVAACVFATSSFAGFQGDINQDNAISLEDIIIGLQVVAGSERAIPVFTADLDVDGDVHLGLPEILNSLRIISEHGEFGTVASAGQVWMDRNLGATRVATSLTDEEAFGDLYQWGRGTDGHEKRDSGTTTTNATSDAPGHGLFISEDATPFDWRTPQNDNLWQGGSGINNPCPAGFRLPTDLEWETERNSWNSNDPAGAYGSPLKLVVAGLRYKNGSFGGVGEFGYYWSATVNLANSSRLYLSNDMASTAGDVYRARGQSVRCVQDGVSTCNASNLASCSTQYSCTYAGGYWFNGTCSPVTTVVSAGQVWMDRNLGAARVATSSTDEEAYGDLYQWGRGTDGHEKRGSLISSVPSDNDNPDLDGVDSHVKSQQ
jgi:uncharacterized protein (TIGR02145 family)